MQHDDTFINFKDDPQLYPAPRTRWYVYNTPFSTEWCEQVISQVQQNVDVVPGFTGNTQVAQGHTKIRECELRWINRGDNKFEWLFEDVWNVITQTNRVCWGFDIARLYEIQFTTYRFIEGQPLHHYEWHSDIIHSNGKSMSERKVSCVIQLSEPSSYEGGNLLVDPRSHGSLPLSVKAQGSAVLFDSFLEHKVQPVTKGVRHSLVAWAEGPLWR